MLAKRLSHLLESSKYLRAGQFGFRNNLGTNHALLFLIHKIQSTLDLSFNSRVVSLDFIALFNRVSHSALIYKIRTAGVAGSFLNILTQFLTNRMQRVSVEANFSDFLLVRSGVPQDSVLGPLVFILYTNDMWHNTKPKMIVYADDATINTSHISTIPIRVL